MSAERDWTVYCNEDGEPWAIFLDGHDHDLRTLRSLNCKDEIRKAFIDFGGDDDDFFYGNLNIGRWWIRTYNDDNEDGDPDYPWVFCEKGDEGAKPITGAKF
jgi:hypothetical protein